jgi:hypothetical protein
MKCGYVPLWLVRDLPPLIGIAWSFWSLMIMVIGNCRRAALVKKISARVHDFIMHQHPIVEAHLRFALHRQVYRALGWDPRVIRLDQADAIAHSSEVTNCLEAYRLSMMELHASAAFALNENSRRHRISTRVDANARAA